MSQPHDRRIHADALRRQDRGNQWARFKRQAGIMLATVALGAMAAPYAMLRRDAFEATGTYYMAKAKIWLFKGKVADPVIRISYGGQAYDVSTHGVIAHPYYRLAVRAVFTHAMRGGGLGFAAWLSCLFLFRGAVKRRRERALRDRVIAGTLVTTEKQLAKLTGVEADSRALAIGTTGSGKTTALRQMLDEIEVRGEAGRNRPLNVRRLEKETIPCLRYRATRRIGASYRS